MGFGVLGSFSVSGPKMPRRVAEESTLHIIRFVVFPCLYISNHISSGPDDKMVAEESTIQESRFVAFPNI